MVIEVNVCACARVGVRVQVCFVCVCVSLFRRVVNSTWLVGRCGTRAGRAEKVGEGERGAFEVARRRVAKWLLAAREQERRWEHVVEVEAAGVLRTAGGN